MEGRYANQGNVPNRIRCFAVKSTVVGILAGLVGLILSGCAGAYVAGDVGAHRDSDHVSLLSRGAPRQGELASTPGLGLRLDSLGKDEVVRIRGDGGVPIFDEGERPVL
jgi:hypothetical protein